MYVSKPAKKRRHKSQQAVESIFQNNLQRTIKTSSEQCKIAKDGGRKELNQDFISSHLEISKPANKRNKYM